jgi:16S rRNA (guanine966-N2)-methyltransferase
MRIIAGKLGGRQFDSPKGHRTHPMSEKARGGLFNVLGDLDELTVLDAFAGSGALAFEAISHGASRVTAIDIDKRANKIIIENARKLGIESKVKVIRASAGAWSDKNPNATFDLVFAAPPYDDLQENILQKLVKHVKAQGVYVLDWPGKLPIPEFEGLEFIKDKDYGDARLVFYRKIP